jgi:hypothetical protein
MQNYVIELFALEKIPNRKPIDFSSPQVILECYPIDDVANHRVNNTSATCALEMHPREHKQNIRGYIAQLRAINDEGRTIVR